MHTYDLILTLTGGLGAALAAGYIAYRLGLSPSSDTCWPGLWWVLTRRGSWPTLRLRNSSPKSA